MSSSTPTAPSDFSNRKPCDPCFPNQACTVKHTPGLKAAAGATSIEADRAKAYGAGEDQFALKSLPGEQETSNQGIKKITTVEFSKSSAARSQIIPDEEILRRVLDMETLVGNEST